MPDASQIAETIASDFYCDRFDFSARKVPAGTAWSLMPEVQAVQRLRNLCPSDRTVRAFLTFVSAMDRARDSTRLWRVAVNLFELHPEAFDPAQLLSMPANTLSALLSGSGVSQRHGPDAEAWHAIANSLASGTGPVYRLVDAGTGDANEVLKDLRSRNCTGRVRFPLLRGPKVGSVWIRIMASPGGAKIMNIDSIPVAVDVQVRRVTENLGVTSTKNIQFGKAKPVIQSAWYDAVRGAKIGGPEGIMGSCAALDPALWVFGKYGCGHCEKEGRPTPVSVACHNCQLPVSSRPASNP